MVPEVTLFYAQFSLIASSHESVGDEDFFSPTLEATTNWKTKIQFCESFCKLVWKISASPLLLLQPGGITKPGNSA